MEWDHWFCRTEWVHSTTEEDVSAGSSSTIPRLQVWIEKFDVPIYPIDLQDLNVFDSCKDSIL